MQFVIAMFSLMEESLKSSQLTLEEGVGATFLKERESENSDIFSHTALSRISFILGKSCRRYKYGIKLL